MKANFINFWCVKSEFIVKNWFHNWTSELRCIWHIFGKLGYFWLFLENPDIQVTVNITVNKDQFICRRLVVASADVLEKRQIFQKMCQITQPVRTLFLFKSIWTRPQGSQGCQKIRFIFLQIKLLSFCANIAPERHKLQKIIKIGEKCQKTPVFLDLFEYSSIWGQY